ncbi:MAG: nucleotidyltransferase family protein [Acidimicrobiia bacterium]|nr:nucleotidyltransferase family protein [Acidimicrobiia bacterium]
MIGGIIMAAGLSERMGGSVPKQLLPYQGTPMVSVVAAVAGESALDEVVVVTGHQGESVAAAVADLGVQVVPNPDYRQGNMTSFLVGYRALPSCSAYVVLLADMPDVTTEMVDRMIAHWRQHQPWAIVAGYRDGRGHPLLLSAAAMEAAVTATGPKAVWRLLESAPDADVATVVFDRSTPLDVNTPADYDQLPEQL